MKFNNKICLVITINLSNLRISNLRVVAIWNHCLLSMKSLTIVCQTSTVFNSTLNNLEANRSRNLNPKVIKVGSSRDQEVSANFLNNLLVVTMEIDVSLFMI